MNATARRRHLGRLPRGGRPGRRDGRHSRPSSGSPKRATRSRRRTKISRRRTRSGPASRSSAARSSITCRRSPASRPRRTSSATTSARRAKLTYYADILKYYRALAAATPRVKIETIGKSDEDRELVVVWVSSEANIKNLQQNRDNLAKLADPRGLPDAQIRQLIATTKPHYHLMGGLHSGETGPSEMLMELVYRLATETSPFITQIRDNVIVSVTPVADADGRDRNVDCSIAIAAAQE